MKRTKKCLAVLSVTAISALLANASVHAADGEIYDLKTFDKIYTLDDLMSMKNQMDVGLHQSKYGYELNNNIYKFKDVNTIYSNEKKAGNTKLSSILQKVEEKAAPQFEIKENNEKLNIAAKEAVNNLENAIKVLDTEENINAATNLIQLANEAVDKLKDKELMAELKEKVDNATKTITDAKAKFENNKLNSEEKPKAIKAVNDAISEIPEEVTNENLPDIKVKLAELDKLINVAKDKGAVDTDFENFDKVQAVKNEVNSIEKGLNNIEIAKKSVEALEKSVEANLDTEEKVNAADALVKPANEAVANIKDEVLIAELKGKIDSATKTITDAKAKLEAVKEARKLAEESVEKLEKAVQQGLGNGTNIENAINLLNIAEESVKKVTDEEVRNNLNDKVNKAKDSINKAKEDFYDIVIDDINGSLIANGRTVMTVVAHVRHFNGDKLEDATNFEGMAEFVSKKGLVAAQKEVAFEKGRVVFNVPLKNYVPDGMDNKDTFINDILKIRIKSNEAFKSNAKNSLVGVESEVKEVKYIIPPISGNEVEDIKVPTVKMYSVDRVASANVADRVVVYVGGVTEEHLKDVENEVLEQVKVASKLTQDNKLDTPINLVKIVGKVKVEGGYAFTALIELPKDTLGKNVLIDNQYNYYEVTNGKEDKKLVKLKPSTEIKKFMLIDNTKPEVRAVKVPTGDESYLSTDNLAVVFSKAINRLTAENPTNYILNGHKLTAEDVNSIKVQDINEDNTPKAVEEGKERNTVILSLKPSCARQYLREGENLLQVRSISDWAGLYDLSDNNKITTQDFTFKYSEPKINVAMKMEEESPEQFKLEISHDLYTDKVASKKFKLGTDNIEVTLDGNKIDKENLEITPVEANHNDLGNEKPYYMLELKNDWTKILNTGLKNAKIQETYHNKNFKVAISGKVYDAYGNEINNEFNSIKLQEDTTSPKIAKFDLEDRKNKEDKDSAEVLTGKVRITMSKPVQLYIGKDGKNSLVEPGITPSIDQEAGQGVPVPTLEYVKLSNNETSEGKRIFGIISEVEKIHDKEFTVMPSEELETGDWKLVVRQISDDVGNTMATEEILFKVVEADKQDVVVPPAKPVDKEDLVNPYIVWAFAQDAKEGEKNDYVYVLYSRQMSVDSLRSSTYNINGKQVGQDADITSKDVELYKENGEGDTWKGQLVTIKLPSDFIVGGDDLDGGTKKNVLTLPNKLSARDDKNDKTVDVLQFDNNSGSNQYELSFEGVKSDEIKLPEIVKNTEFKNIGDFRKFLEKSAKVEVADGLLAEANKEVDAVQKEVDAAKEEVEAIEKEIKDLEAKHESTDAAKEKLKTANEKKTAAEEKLKKANEKKTAAEAKLEEAKTGKPAAPKVDAH